MEVRYDQTITDETFEAQLRADDQNVLWVIDSTDWRYQLAVAAARRLAHLRRDPYRAVLEEHGFGSGRVR
jgi:hypothetical protein